MKIVSLLISLLIFTGLGAELNWRHLYFSGSLAVNQRDIRIEASGNDPLILIKDSESITTTSMPPLNDGFDSHQVRITESNYPYIGFRHDADTTSVILPVYHDGISPLGLNSMTQAITDPVGDAVFNQTYLDILNCYVSFSQDKFYFAIINNGGGFPVSSGFTFFSYLAVMINPATANDPQQTVWGLMYTIDMAGIISPGLYRIAGTSTSDMTLLGEIQTELIPGSNCLLLSCNKADLLADPAFSAWFDEDHPIIGCQIITDKISLSAGTLLADQTNGFNLVYMPVSIPQDVASAPQLTNAIVAYLPESNVEFNVEYNSPEHYLPVTAQLVIDNNHWYDMIPTQYPDFNGTVHYSALLNTSITGNWSQAVIRFSPDGVIWSEVTLNGTPNSDQIEVKVPSELIRRIYPNPAINNLKIELVKTSSPIRMEIFNLKGQRIYSKIVSVTDEKNSLDLSGLMMYQASGLYLIKASAGKQSQIVKFLLQKGN